MLRPFEVSVATRLGAGCALAAALLLAGCGGERSSPSAGVSVRDSADVEIVTSAVADRPFAVSEVLRIGVVDGDPDYLFDGIRSVAIASDGSIWVSDSDPRIRRYSAEGAFITAAGGEGSGPGESPRGYGDVWTADSVVVVIPYSADVQVFGGDGAFLGGRSIATPEGRAAYPMGSVGNGWIFRQEVTPEGADRRLRTEWVVLAAPLFEGEMTPVLTLPGTPRVRTVEGGVSSGAYLDGFPYLGVGEDRIYYSDAVGYEVRVFDPTGRLMRIVRRDTDPIPVEPDLMNGIEAELEAGWPEVSGGAALDATQRDRMLFAAAPSHPPEHLPFLDRVLPSPDGSIWVRRADQHPNPPALAAARALGYLESFWPERWRSASVFDLFDADGAYRGTARLPVEFSPLAVSGDRIYGTVIDALGVHYVAAYAVDGVG